MVSGLGFRGSGFRVFGGVGLRVLELLGFTAFRASGLVRKTGASVKGLGF